jgi:hypothetical protein
MQRYVEHGEAVPDMKTVLMRDGFFVFWAARIDFTHIT